MQKKSNLISITKQPRDERGQALVEFAFSLVILLLLISGLVDTVRVFSTYLALRDSAEEGALFASISPNDASNIRARVKNSSDLVHGLQLTDGEIAIKCTNDSGTEIGCNTACVGQSVKITITLNNYEMTMPFWDTFMGKSSVTLRVTANNTVLRPKCP